MTTGPNHRTEQDPNMLTEPTPIYDQLARERDAAMQDPEGLAPHEHHRRTLAGWFGWIR